MNRIELLNMDCMVFMKNCPDNAFDLPIVDPPYFDGPQSKVYYGKSVSSTNVKRLSKNSKHWQKVNLEYFQELRRVSKKYIFWGCNYYPEFIFHTGRIVWDKVNHTSGFSDCELAATDLFSHTREFAFMWNGMLQGKSINEGRIQQGNKSKNEKRIHPTQKPVALYKWLLTNYAKPGDKLLDTHSGSGSFRIAAYDLGFDLVSCELDPDYCRDNEARFQRHIQQIDLFKPEEIQEKIFTEGKLF